MDNIVTNFAKSSPLSRPIQHTSSKPGSIPFTPNNVHRASKRRAQDPSETSCDSMLGKFRCLLFVSIMICLTCCSVGASPSVRRNTNVSLFPEPSRHTTGVHSSPDTRNAFSRGMQQVEQFPPGQFLPATLHAQMPQPTQTDHPPLNLPHLKETVHRDPCSLLRDCGMEEDVSGFD